MTQATPGISQLMAAIFLSAALSASADVLLDVSLGEKGAPVVGADRLLTEGGVSFARKLITPTSGAGGYWGGLGVQLSPSVDLSAPGTVIRLTARYFQGGGNPNPYSDAPIWVVLRDAAGKSANVGTLYGASPALKFPRWMTCLGEAAKGRRDAGFDLQRVVSVEFGGTDWKGKGDDFVDVSRLQIIRPGRAATGGLTAALRKPDGAQVEFTGMARPGAAAGALFECEDILHCATVDVIDTVPPEAVQGLSTGGRVWVSGTLAGAPGGAERIVKAVAWAYAPAEETMTDARPLQRTCRGLRRSLARADGPLLGKRVQVTGSVCGPLPARRSVLLTDAADAQAVRVDLGGLPSWRQPALYHGDRLTVTGLCCVETGADGSRRPVLRVLERAGIEHHWPAGDPPKTVRVAVVCFDPPCPAHGGKTVREEMKWHEPRHAAEEYIRSLREASNGWCLYQVVSWFDARYFPDLTDGYRFDPDAYVDGWRGPDRAKLHHCDTDMVRLLTDNTYPHNQPKCLVERVAGGEVDEVFLFGAPTALAGPDPFFINGACYPLPQAKRNFAIMGFNYERELGCMLEDFCHRTECTLSRVFQTRDLWFPTLPFNNDWDRFRAFEQRLPGLSACGITHYGPSSASDYDWGNNRLVWCTCDDWLYNWPNLKGAETRRLVSAPEWGGGGMEEHHVWWLNHLPKATGADGKQRNWWKYVVMAAP